MDQAPRSKLGLTAILAIIAFAGLLAAQVYTFTRLRSAESKLTAIESRQSEVRGALDGEIGKMRESQAAADAEQRKSIEAIRDEVSKAQRRGPAGRVKDDTSQRVEALARRVEVNESKLKQQQEVGARVVAEVSTLKQTAGQSNVASVAAEVKQIQTEVAGTQGQVEKIIADLKRTTGDLGVMSGLIATNTREIDALKQLGDRDYIEFTLYKRKDPIKLGDVSVLLKKTDAKANTYTLELQANDRKLEKKDKTANEPVQFYVGRERQPHELVVNEVGKDMIVGYLAIPKAAQERP
jgi:hypothetical protein